MYKNFVKVWMDVVERGGGTKAVAQRLNMNTSNVSARANYLRKRGVNLPNMPRSSSADVLDVEQLNSLIATRS